MCHYPLRGIVGAAGFIVTGFLWQAKAITLGRACIEQANDIALRTFEEQSKWHFGCLASGKLLLVSTVIIGINICVGYYYFDVAKRQAARQRIRENPSAGANMMLILGTTILTLTLSKGLLFPKI